VGKEELTVEEPVKVTVTLPATMFKENADVYIKHVKTDKNGADTNRYYETKAESGGKVTFVTDGFSPFGFSTEDTAVFKIETEDGRTIGYDTISEALDDVEKGTTTTIKVMTENAKNADPTALVSNNNSNRNKTIKLVTDQDLEDDEAISITINGVTKKVKSDATDETWKLRTVSTASDIIDSGNNNNNNTSSGGSSGGGGGGSSSSSTSQSASVSSGKGGTAVADKNGKVTITPDDGYEIDVVTVNGVAVEVPANGVLTGLKSTDKVVVSFKETEAHSFSDIPSDYWAKDAIDWAYSKGYINGKTSDSFDPTGKLSRQQIWMIMARAAGADPADMAAAKAWAIANGVSDGTNPGSSITRQQMVTILYRAAGLLGVAANGSTDLTSFPDAGNVSGYANEAMSWAVANGIVNGTTDGTLNPTGTATRAQFATILMRFFGAAE
jgi:hypothetical protein